jgi:hypothetical protein
MYGIIMRYSQINIGYIMIPDQDITTNELGGKQSYTGTRYDLLPTIALECIANVLHTGALKYGEDNWKLIPCNEHVNHAIRHLIRYNEFRCTEELSHAATRSIFALFTHLTERKS